VHCLNQPRLYGSQSVVGGIHPQTTDAVRHYLSMFNADERSFNRRISVPIKMTIVMIMTDDYGYCKKSRLSICNCSRYMLRGRASWTEELSSWRMKWQSNDSAIPDDLIGSTATAAGRQRSAARRRAKDELSH